MTLEQEKFKTLCKTIKTNDLCMKNMSKLQIWKLKQQNMNKNHNFMTKTLKRCNLYAKEATFMQKMQFLDLKRYLNAKDANFKKLNMI